MRKLKLTNSDLVCLVDDEDYEELSKYSWRIKKDSKHKTYFTVRGRVGNKEYYLHRFILNAPDWKETKLVIDHIDRDTLNNQKSNLRIVTQQINVLNTKKIKQANYSVCKAIDTWRLRKSLTKQHLGSFKTKEEALLARDQLLLLDFGVNYKYFTFEVDYIKSMPAPAKLTKGSSSIEKLKGVERPENRKYNRPSKEELHKLVWSMPTIQVANSLGCSDKAVEKWCKFIGVEKPPKGFWQKIKYNKLEGQTCLLF